MTTTPMPPSSPTSSQGLPAPRDPAPAGDLDTRIKQVELRLIAREERLHTEARRVIQRGRKALRPVQLLASLTGAVAAVAGVAWAVRRLGSPPVLAAGRGAAFAGTERGSGAGMSATATPPGAGRTEVPWVQWLGLAWPLLPASWRARVSPGVAAAVASVGLPLLQQLAQHLRGSQQPELPTVQHVDLTRYAGTWYEVARLPMPFEAACVGQPSATYTLRGGEIAVVNRCVHAGGEAAVHGVARVVPGSGNARLRVSLWPTWLRWLPFAWADYWVLHLDADYDTALVGHPNRRFLWLLSRSRTLSEARKAELVDLAVQRGFNVRRLHFNAP